jgi:hypothetical protein
VCHAKTRNRRVGLQEIERTTALEDPDVDVLFDHQADPQAVQMAAFPAREKDQFAAHWAKVRADEKLVVCLQNR